MAYKTCPHCGTTLYLSSLKKCPKCGYVLDQGSLDTVKPGVGTQASSPASAAPQPSAPKAPTAPAPTSSVPTAAPQPSAPTPSLGEKPKVTPDGLEFGYWPSKIDLNPEILAESMLAPLDETGYLLIQGKRYEIIDGSPFEVVPILWIPVKREGNIATLVAWTVLERRRFNPKGKETRYEDSEIKKYLEGEFVRKAFGSSSGRIKSIRLPDRDLFLALPEKTRLPLDWWNIAKRFGITEDFGESAKEIRTFWTTRTYEDLAVVIKAYEDSRSYDEAQFQRRGVRPIIEVKLD